jgi:hypothetical protein
MSIVLVVIGLIVGGILVGQNLIAAAGVRATISQIEKYNQAANTFYGKYGALPGDIADPAASSFGFKARGTLRGQGDGNGIIEGTDSVNGIGVDQAMGETCMFWVDLSTAYLIDGGFNACSPNIWGPPDTQATILAFFPQAKIGQGNSIYVYSNGYVGAPWTTLGTNFFGISSFIHLYSGGWPTSNLALTVSQAYSIDAKLDDGLPQSGSVIASYVNIYPYWAGTNKPTKNGPYTTATPGSSSTCFDNGNVASAAQQYSLAQNNGSGVNCGLSFQMQGAGR